MHADSIDRIAIFGERIPVVLITAVHIDAHVGVGLVEDRRARQLGDLTGLVGEFDFVPVVVGGPSDPR